MTLLLVRVSDAHEAAQVAAAGIDAVEVVMDGTPDPDLAVARAVREAFPGVLRLRLPEAEPTSSFGRAAAEVEADEIAFPLSASKTPSLADAALPARLKSVAILSISDTPDALIRARDSVGAVMLDAGDERRLVDKAGIAKLDAFATACRASGLSFGLAGGLETPDIARLLLLKPDVLSFDAAVRRRHVRDGAIDTDALDALRALVPRRDETPAAGSGTIAKVIDRIFVRDLEIALAIGAYQAEHGKSQRVRFSVEADIVREAGTPRDMRDVFSYDVIIETIRVLSERAHVTFVETLAEEVAASLLMHAEVLDVKVKVEKLDVIAGAVGIEIMRRRDTP